MNNSSGQTMVEAIVAVAIIGIALVGFLSQSTFNYISVSESFNRNIALNLAREALEVARNVRDSNWLKGCPNPEVPATCFAWNSGFSQGAEYRAVPFFDSNKKEYTLSFLGKTFDACVGDKSCILFQNESGTYTASPLHAVETNFYRQMELRPICEDAFACGGDGVCVSGEHCPGKQIGIEAVAKVRWRQGDGWRNEMVMERLYNWR